MKLETGDAHVKPLAVILSDHAREAPNGPAPTHVPRAERVEPIDVNGTPGWVITDEGEAGDEITVAWSPENDRTVVGRSIAPRATVIEAAQALEPVSKDEWNAVFPS